MMEVDLRGSGLFPSSLFFNRGCDSGGYSWSELSSTFGSELGSTDTEGESSEGEEQDSYIAELTRQMAHSMLQDDEKEGKPLEVAGSPQSTLRSLSGSRRESPADPSRELSPPPLTPMIGSFEKMKINEENPSNNQVEGLFGKPTSLPSSDTGFQARKSLIDSQIRAFQLQRIKQEQALKQGETGNYRACVGFNKDQKKELRPYHVPCPTPYSTLQEQRGNSININEQSESGMEAVLLGGSSSRCGTGVFLPRGTGTPCESRKKTGCPTVLIPARVVQALKLHFDKVGKVLPSTFNSSEFTLQNNDLILKADGSLSPSQSQSLSRAPSQPVNQQEISLPQEWTY
ncbi:uncharacterized protein LOC110812217 isoform X2 [Carica papaya]|uniref:uncharacterized protein LOC110812217 isoform X2 n=1 Tax=Carica papaya TaxID=3649 RepID=UPI000B8CA4AB|nr:uncharacterized protein LOC110812217 isoform X2 [Carica papaya]